MSDDRRAGLFGPAEDPVDRLIDEAARELTAGSPSPALRTRVRARIESRELSRSGGRRARLVWKPALAAGALALLAFLVTRSRDPDVTTPGTAPPPEVARRSEAVGSPVVEAVEPARPAPPEGARASARAARARRAVEGDASGSTGDPVAPLEGALPPIDLIAIEPVALARAAVERIPEPMPVRIDRMLVEQLDLQ